MIQLDENQQQLQTEFDNLKAKIESGNFLSNSFLKLLSKKDRPLGLYIYSKPGRGKTMLMQDFYNKIKSAKKYFHFNEFMYQIHRNNHQIRSAKSKDQYSNKDLIISLKKVIGRVRLICFDEFQVTDIADAMILERIFSYFFDQNIYVVVTSNSHPLELYPEGIQREVFMKFVKSKIVNDLKLINFKSDIDYRLIHKDSISNRYFLSDQDQLQDFNALVANLTNKQNPKSRALEVWGRKVEIPSAVDNIAIFSYDELFQENRSAADYRVIAKEFDLIILRDLDKFNSESKNEIKRFMLFIDEIYENKTALVINAKVEIFDLYSKEKDDKMNSRVTSRLSEIKSDYYFNNSKYIQK